MDDILQNYLRRLTNLSSNSRSLLLLRLISDQFIDIPDFDYSIENKNSFHIVELLMGNAKKIPLCQEIDSRDKDANILSKKIKKLNRIDQFIFQERGAKDLYVGWPFIRGKFSNDMLVRCPLVFFPVEIFLEKGNWYLKNRADVNITLNKTFLLAYSYYNEVSLDEELIEKVIDPMQDSLIFRTKLYEILKESKIEINFNRENFEDKLEHFSNFKKTDLFSKEKTGQLKLYPEAVLGIFPQAGSYLVPDYLSILASNTIGTISDFFKNENLDQKVKEENTFTPFEMDAYQENALQKIKEGKSLVIQGPPGSGKSQLISNLIGDYIAREKNVLLVCQKKAALDVVWERMQSKNLHDFIGLVHDFKNDRQSIFQQIQKQIEALEEYKDDNNSLDAIQLERNFRQVSRKIEILIEELNDFKKALFDDSECGISVKELYLMANTDAKTIAINQEYRQFPYHSLDEFEKKLNLFTSYFERFDHKENFWTLGPSFAQYKAVDWIKIKEFLNEIHTVQNQITEQAKSFTKQPVDYETIRFFIDKRAQFQTLIDYLTDNKKYELFKILIVNHPEKEKETLERLELAVMSCFEGVGPEKSLPFNEIGRLQKSIINVLKARSRLFSWIKWKLTSQDKVFISRVLVANGLKSNKMGYDTMLKKLDNRLNLEHYHSEIQSIPWMGYFPNVIDKKAIQNWFFSIKEALKAYAIRNEIRSLPEYISVINYEHRDYLDKLKSLVRLLDDVEDINKKWRAYFSDTQIRLLMMNKIKAEDAQKDLAKNFEDLVNYHKIKSEFKPQEQSLVSKLTENFTNKNECIALFKNSLATAWIEHLETKNPILKKVSTLEFEENTKELRRLITEKNQISESILLLKSKERTYSHLEYNRLNNRITYRDLHHQVTKKRQKWPIRRVVSEFKEELFQLLPCWLASPESTSAIFPLEPIFDLVIFDEASQCFSEHGLPAMYRAKQIVVVGDDKQLKPNDLYRVKWEDTTQSDVLEIEIDSLLDLAKNHIPQMALQGHYRSQNLELIDFSNEHFYGGKLKLLPHYHVMNSKDPPIKYLKVEGIWENNSNTAEASKVVDLVEKLAKTKPNKSIGIVTFNANQQNLLLDYLESSTLKNKIPKNLFVKNIENVQGDERDIIIFSTAYAPDTQGKLKVQFGSLNQLGGENRLNVAITRAKEEIYLVCSILPHQLNVENTQNKGPKILKQYLEYAHNVHNQKVLPNPFENPTNNTSGYLRDGLKNLMPMKEIQLKKNFIFSDLSVMKQNEILGIILTDDDLFYHHISAKQTYAYEYFNLLEKKWNYLRLFSREYWLDRKGMQEKMERFIERIS